MKNDTPDPSLNLFELPSFDLPQIERWPSTMSWERAVRAFDWQRKEYMLKFDSPAQRLRDKNPEPFRMD